MFSGKYAHFYFLSFFFYIPWLLHSIQFLKHNLHDTFKCISQFKDLCPKSRFNYANAYINSFRITSKDLNHNVSILNSCSSNIYPYSIIPCLVVFHINKLGAILVFLSLTLNIQAIKKPHFLAFKMHPESEHFTLMHCYYPGLSLHHPLIPSQSFSITPVIYFSLFSKVQK